MNLFNHYKDGRQFKLRLLKLPSFSWKKSLRFSKNSRLYYLVVQYHQVRAAFCFSGSVVCVCFVLFFNKYSLLLSSCRTRNFKIFSPGADLLNSACINFAVIQNQNWIPKNNLTWLCFCPALKILPGKKNHPKIEREAIYPPFFFFFKGKNQNSVSTLGGRILMTVYSVSCNFYLALDAGRDDLHCSNCGYMLAQVIELELDQ